MKRILCFLFFLTLLPAVSLADDPDPIIGSWYLSYDTSSFPELDDIFGSDYFVQILCFLPDGTVTAAYITDSNGEKTSAYSAAGSWSKKDSVWYDCNILGIGKVDCLIVNNDNLQMKAGNNSDIYFVMHRMINFDPYSEFIYR